MRVNHQSQDRATLPTSTRTRRARNGKNKIKDRYRLFLKFRFARCTRRFAN